MASFPDMWPGLLNPANWYRAVKLAANLDLSDKLIAEREMSARLRDERDDMRAERDDLRKRIASQEQETAGLHQQIAALKAPPASLVYQRVGNLLWRGEGRTEADGPICALC